MKKIALAAIAASFAVAGAANAATYRVDVTAAEGVHFAPFGAGEMLTDGAEVSAAVKLQAIDGKPVDAYPGHGNKWFIIEADEGSTVLFTAMNGKSIDTIGQAVIELPAATDVTEIVDILENQVVAEEVIMDGNGESIVKKTYADVKVGEMEVVVDSTPAERVSEHNIAGYDAGADEGRDTLMASGSLGSVKVTRLSK